MKILFLAVPLLLSACVGTPVRDSVADLLVGREVIYDIAPDLPPENADRQTWAADGTTIYNAGPGMFGGPTKGRWFVENGMYCAYFGTQMPKDRDCWWVSTSDNGARIRFKKAGIELIDFGPREYNGTFVK